MHDSLRREGPMSSLLSTRRALARAGALAVTATSLALLAPLAAQAAAPTVSTGAATRLSPQTASLSGTVNAKGKTTVFFFQIGPTKAYGVNTAEGAAGNATTNRSVTTNLVGLQPATTYHYRLVARNADGTTVGADRSFKTKNQPLGFSLEATPNPVGFGDAVVLQGVLSGTGNAGRQVALQRKEFPFTVGFKTLGNPQVTGTTGSFAFPLLGVTTNAQYRVVTTAGAKVTSSIVTVGVAVKVSTKLGARSVKRGHRIRFSGKITPAKVGALYAIQRQDSNGNWKVVAGSVSHAGGTTYSTFNTKARIRKSGLYRVFVGVTDGYQVSGVGATKKISIKR